MIPKTIQKALNEFKYYPGFSKTYNIINIIATMLRLEEDKDLKKKLSKKPKKSYDYKIEYRDIEIHFNLNDKIINQKDYSNLFKKELVDANYIVSIFRTDHNTYINDPKVLVNHLLAIKDDDVRANVLEVLIWEVWKKKGYDRPLQISILHHDFHYDVDKYGNDLKLLDKARLDDILENKNDLADKLSKLPDNIRDIVIDEIGIKDMLKNRFYPNLEELQEAILKLPDNVMKYVAKMRIEVMGLVGAIFAGFSGQSVEEVGETLKKQKIGDITPLSITMLKHGRDMAKWSKEINQIEEDNSNDKPILEGLGKLPKDVAILVEGEILRKESKDLKEEQKDLDKRYEGWKKKEKSLGKEDKDLKQCKYLTEEIKNLTKQLQLWNKKVELHNAKAKDLTKKAEDLQKTVKEPVTKEEVKEDKVVVKKEVVLTKEEPVVKDQIKKEEPVVEEPVEVKEPIKEKPVEVELTKKEPSKEVPAKEKPEFPFKKHLIASAIPTGAIFGVATLLLFSTAAGVTYYLYKNPQSLSEQMQKFIVSVVSNYEKYIIVAAAITISVMVIAGLSAMAIEYGKYKESSILELDL